MAKTKKSEKTGPIRNLWLQFRKRVIPKTAPHVQVQEMHLAFYAGAQATLNLVSELGREEISEEQGVEALKSLDTEIVQFIAGRVRKH